MTYKQYDWKDALGGQVTSDDEIRKQVGRITEREMTITPIKGTHLNHSKDRMEFNLYPVLSFGININNKKEIDTTDGEYSQALKFNKQQFGWIIKQLQKLQEMMDD